ncbi:CARDB domain-containing protein [Thermococcus aciditolerans]|nr:CARDB domain-containing protein [Thermococcus aciditolerans]
MVNGRNVISAALLVAILVVSTVPVGAWISMSYNSQEKVQVFGGTLRDWYGVNDSITVFALLWRPYGGPLEGRNVTITVLRDGEVILSTTAVTDETGRATVTFRPETAGEYEVIVRYGDTAVEKWFKVIAVPPYYFAGKEAATVPGRPVTLRWTLMKPYTRRPYTGNVNLTVEFNGKTESVTLTPVNGTVEYTFTPGETGTAYLRLDGREAGTVYVAPAAVEAVIIAPHDVYRGENVTLSVFAVDFDGRPYTGKLNLSVHYRAAGDWELRDGGSYTVALDGGYGSVTITIPENATELNLRLTIGDYTLDSVWVRAVDRPSTSTGSGGVTLRISPERTLAKPGESLSLEITASEKITGDYNVMVTWYRWTGNGWNLPEETNVTLVHFEDTDSVYKRIEVPDDAYYGRVSLGGAVAYIYVIRPRLWADFDYVDFIYDPTTGEIVTANNVTVRAWLQNRTRDWIPEWSDLYRGLPNETVHIYTPEGVFNATTNKYGMIETTVPYSPSSLPVGFGEEMNKEWALIIHRSGAYDLDSIEVNKIHVQLNLTPEGITASKYYDWHGRPISIPVVLELSRFVTREWDELSIGDTASWYWNGSELREETKLAPGKYLASILPAGWLCNEGSCGTGDGVYSTHEFYLLPEGLELNHMYSAPDLNNITIPIRLPGRGVFYFRTYDGVYVGTTDDEGNGVLRLEAPYTSDWIHYDGTFGFVTENVSILGIDWWFGVEIGKDVLPPAVDVSVSPKVQEIGKNVTLTYRVSDDYGLKTVNIAVTNVTDVLLNRTIEASGSRRVEGTINFTVRGLEDYMVTVTAVDGSGHVSTKTVNFYGKAVKSSVVDFSENETHEINVENETEIKVAANETGQVEVNVTVASEIENDTAKFKMESSGYEDLKYIKVETNDTVNYRWVVLNITYTDEELRKLGVAESAISLFYWNGSEWIDLAKHVGETVKDSSPYGNITVYGFGRDTDRNYVWANVSHLSEYSLGVMLPDLKVVEISAANAVAGRETEVSVTLANDGGAVDGDFTVSLYANGTLVKTERVSGIGAGEEKTVKFTWTPDRSGTYTLKAIVDEDGAITESNETNNELSAEVRVAPAPKVNKGTAVTRMNYIGYLYYHRLSRRFDELYNESLRKGVDNETLTAALEHRKLAEEYYEKAEEFGPVLQNLSNPQVLAPLRRAYLEMLKAVRILEEALG